MTRINTTNINSRSTVIGDFLTLPCDTSGLRRIIRTAWERQDGRSLPSNSYIDDMRSLVILMTGLEDAGVYNCIVETNMGVATVQYNVTVEGKS